MLHGMCSELVILRSSRLGHEVRSHSVGAGGALVGVEWARPPGLPNDARTLTVIVPGLAERGVVICSTPLDRAGGSACRSAEDAEDGSVGQEVMCVGGVQGTAVP